MAQTDTYIIDPHEVLSTSASGLSSLVESFSGASVDSRLLTTGFDVLEGSIHRSRSQNFNDRAYVQTTNTDVLSGDFRFEVSLRFDKSAIAYVGLGSGRPDPGNNNEPQDAINFRIHDPSLGDGFVSVSSSRAGELAKIGNIRQVGSHRARIEKLGSQLTFSIDAHYTGEYAPDMSYTFENGLSQTAFMQSGNVRLFFGSGQEDVQFDDVLYVPLPRPGLLANDSDADGNPLEAILVTGPTHGTLNLQPNGSFVYTPSATRVGRDRFQYLARAADGDSAVTWVEIQPSVSTIGPVAMADTYQTVEDSLFDTEPPLRDLHRIPLPTSASNEMVYSRARNRFYVGISDPTAPSLGAVQEIDPSTGTLGRLIVVGGAPTELAVSDDGTFLYVSLGDVRKLTRVDLATGNVAQAISLDGLIAEDIEVFPGAAGKIAVSLAQPNTSPRTAGGAVYDNLVKQAAQTVSLQNNFDFNDDGSRVVAHLPESSSRDVDIIDVTSSRWRLALHRDHFIPGNPEGEIQWTGDRIFFDSGQVFQASNLEFLGFLTWGTITADAALGRFFAVNQDRRVIVSSMSNLETLHQFVVPELAAGTVTGLTRFGTDGLALRSGNELIAFRTVLVTALPGPRGPLVNDLPVGDSPLALRVTKAPAHGTVVLNNNGSFTYQPNANFSGSDSFEYAIVHSFAESKPVAVAMQVLPSNDRPIPTEDRYGFGQNRTHEVSAAQGVLANDLDPDSDSLSAELVTGTAHGALTFRTDGSFSYTPNPGFVGIDTFTYRASDGTVSSGSTQVELRVDGRSVLVSLAAVPQPTSSDTVGRVPNSLTRVNVGDDYYVEVWVQSLADPVQGILGGQVNFGFDTSMTDVLDINHGLLFNQLTSGQVIESQGMIRELGGATLSQTAGVAGWARLGSVHVEATADGPSHYSASASLLQFNLTMQGNVRPRLVDFPAPISVEHFAGATVDLTVASAITQVDWTGQVATLPPSLSWVDEWSTFWVEVWARSIDQGVGRPALREATIDLRYDTRYLTPQTILAGPALDAPLSAVVDDPNGVIRGLGGQFHGERGVDGHVLVARVQFASSGDDQVPVDRAGKKVGPYRLGLKGTDPIVRLANDGAQTPTEILAAQTEIWSVPYDFDDNNVIDFGDLSYFAADFGKRADADRPNGWWSDLDKSGQVDFNDFRQFANNFGKSRANGNIQFPTNYPDAWRGETPSAPEIGAASGTDTRIRVSLVAVPNLTPSDTVASLPPSYNRVEKGQMFTVELWVQDPSMGITGGYVDLKFPQAAVTVGEVFHGGVFTLLAHGTVLPTGLVDDFGGGTLQPRIGVAPSWTRFGSFAMQATGTGPISLELLPGQFQFSRFGNGNVAWNDVALGRLILNRRPGDVDGDASVTFTDFLILSSHFGQAVDNVFARDLNFAGDLNEDGKVDFSDFLILSSNF